MQIIHVQAGVFSGEITTVCLGSTISIIRQYQRLRGIVVGPASRDRGDGGIGGNDNGKSDSSRSRLLCEHRWRKVQLRYGGDNTASPLRVTRLKCCDPPNVLFEIDNLSQRRIPLALIVAAQSLEFIVIIGG